MHSTYVATLFMKKYKFILCLCLVRSGPNFIPSVRSGPLGPVQKIYPALVSPQPFFPDPTVKRKEKGLACETTRIVEWALYYLLFVIALILNKFIIARLMMWVLYNERMNCLSARVQALVNKSLIW